MQLKMNRMIKSTLVYTMSSFLNSGISVLLLPVLTHYLTTEQYGVLSMINATISIITPFTGMSISLAIQRKIVGSDKQDSQKYVFNCIIIAIVSTIIVSIVFVIFSNAISSITDIPKKYFELIIFISFLDSFVSTASAIVQFVEKPLIYAIYRNSETLVNVVLSILFVISFGLALDGRVYGIFISKVIAAVCSFFLIKKFIGIIPKINSAHIKDELLNFGLPMIPTLLKSTILTYLDRIFITNMETISETGVYTVGNQFSLPVLLLAQAFNLAYVPWLFKKLEQNSNDDKKRIVLLNYGYFIGITIVSLLWIVCAEFLIKYVIGNEYAASSQYIIWLSLGYAFTGMHMMVVNYIYYMKRVKLYNLVTITVIFSTVVLNYILINLNGAVGAAQATLIVNIISFVLTWIMASHVYRMPWFKFKRL